MPTDQERLDGDRAISQQKALKQRKGGIMIPTIGQVVIVMGYKARIDGTNEEPGIVNGVVENPTAEEVLAAEEARAKVEKIDHPAGAPPRPSANEPPALTADVSPCKVDVALFPYRADHRNLQDVPFFASRDKAMDYFEGLPKSTDGAVGCVAYFPEKVAPGHDAKRREAKELKEQEERERATKEADKAAKEAEREAKKNPKP